MYLTTIYFVIAIAMVVMTIGMCYDIFSSCISGFMDFDRPFTNLILLTQNRSLMCLNYQVLQDNIVETQEEIVLLRLTSTFSDVPTIISVPMLTVIIEPDPPTIAVPEFVDASEGNAAVVCFLAALIPTNGEVAIGLSSMNINTSE